jgi:Domain of unknown function (DUF4132)
LRFVRDQASLLGEEPLANGFWNRFKAGVGLAAGGSTGSVGALPVRKIAAHFRPLVKQGRGLPDEIADYVAAGGQSSLILKLQGQTIQNAWRMRGRSYPLRDEAGLFTNLAHWRADQMMRLGEVLGALEPISYDWGYYGTKKSPDWLRHVVTQWLGHDRKDQPVETLRDLADHGGLGLPAVLDIVFCRDAASYGAGNSVSRFAGVAPMLEAERDAVAAAMPDAAADVRAELVAAIGRFGIQASFLPMLLDAAIGSSKKVRGSARQALTGSDGAALSALIAERFAKASPGQRAEMVEVAALTLGDAAPALLAGLRAGETSAKVLAAFDRTSGATAASSHAGAQTLARPDSAEGYTAVDGTWVDLPTLEEMPQATKLDRGLLKVLEPAAAEFNRMLLAARQQAADTPWHWSKQYQTVERATLENLAKLAEGTYRISPNQTAVAWLRHHQFRHPAADQFLDDPRLSLYHLVRIAVATGNQHFHGLFNDWSGPAGPAIKRRLAQGADIRTIIDLWIANGGGDLIAEHLSRRWYWPLPDIDVPLWPVVAGSFAQLDEALGIVPQSGEAQLRPSAALELLAHLPKLPERYRGRLMILANDSSSLIRKPARELLRETPGIGPAIALQLEDGRQDVRALAADWLARRGERDQAPAIRKALTRDKSDVARAAMISALERMGEDVSEYFDHAAMVKEAKAGIAKLKLKALDWFPFERLPALHWADGSPVDPLLPRWWVLLAGKLKQPGGNALMTLWLDRLAPSDAHKLGWMVLTCWIDEDVRCPTDEEANAHAAAHVDATLQQNLSYAKRWPESADYFPTDRAVVFARLKAAKAGTYLGSAADSKGVLALCSRVNGADAAQRVRAFLKDHGARVSQAKALLEALAANGSSPALQVVLAAANRSKQKSVQAHAATLIEAVAERNGWTAAQLADRTVPTGGFDADGTLELDCGEGRVYTARLDEHDAIVVFNADGREVKALPGPRIDEERPAVEAAKKLLSNARKEVKQVFGAQGERLQEAMCLQRSWPREDWQSFVIGHPIVGRIAARLVWQGIDRDGQEAATFRPLGDGSFTDAEDSDVDIADFAEVRLAHSSLLNAAQIASWRKHLADYAVEPPFDQFGRDLPQLTEALAKARTITDREGWMVETFKLRGSAGKLGYQRGPAQDGGWFLTYEKTYRDAGLVVEIEFTGSPLPEENRNAALQTLAFRKLGGGGMGGAQVPLGDVPPVLLAECWHDLHEIAGKGTGFDPDWNKKAYG